MKKTLLAVLLPICLLCACGQNTGTSLNGDNVSISESVTDVSINTTDEESVKITTDISEEAISDSEEKIEKPVEEIPEEKEEEKPYLFNFVDVFKKEYETEIKVGFPTTDLVKEGFSFEEGFTLYEDDNYYSRRGVDVSNKQKAVNWKKVKDAGIEFAIIRLGYRGYGSYGDINIDLQFHNNMKGAKEQGIDVGVYFFAQAVNEEEALEEAEFVLKNLEGYELELPVVYDPESILKDVARTDNVTGEQFTKNTIAFCERVKEAGYQPMIYSNMLWEAFQFDMEQLTDYPFWYADYEEYPQTPYAFTMWQYSEKGHVDGIYTPVDLNIQFIRKDK